MKRSYWGVGVLGVILLAIAWSSRGFLRDTAARMMTPTIPTARPFVVDPLSPTSTPSLCQRGYCVPTSTASGTVTSTPPTPVSPEVGRLPAQVNLAVPFLSQAPKQNWDMPYQEACEEASMIMVNAYLAGQQKAFTPETGDKAILDLIAFEGTQHLGADITAAQASQVISAYFPKRTARVIQNPTVTQVRDYLAQGIPVIVPADGKALHNPNFRNGGPPYHMLVIKGYLPDGRWITNDPGTRKGADYIYDREVLWNAIRDWNGGDVPHATPTILVMEPST